MYDVIIIGAGPAGLAAGLYAARKNLKTLIISKDIGGQVVWTGRIENYPGRTDIESGARFMLEIKKQVDGFGVEFKSDMIQSIKKSPSNGGFIVHGMNQQYESEAIIIAAGLEHRTLGVPGEKKFTGRGVTYCAICDGPMFAGKEVAVVGSGTAGLQAAEFLLNICPQVYLLEMLEDYQGDPIVVDKIKKNGKLKFLPKTTIKEIYGNNFVTKISLNTQQTIKELDVQGVFIEIGYKTNTQWLQDLVELNQQGEIKVNKICATNIPGIFAAGDVTDTRYKQIIIAEGMGAAAALAVNDYLLGR